MHERIPVALCFVIREQQALGGRKHKFRFMIKLLSLDSTTISLCLTMFPCKQPAREEGRKG